MCSVINLTSLCRFGERIVSELVDSTCAVARVTMCIFFFQAEDGIRDLVRSRGLGDVYKRQGQDGNRNFRAVKVWDKREFKDYDDTVELGTRNIKLSLIHI